MNNKYKNIEYYYPYNIEKSIVVTKKREICNNIIVFMILGFIIMVSNIWMLRNISRLNNKVDVIRQEQIDRADEIYLKKSEYNTVKGEKNEKQEDQKSN